MSALGEILSTVDISPVTVTASTPGATVTIGVANTTGIQIFTWTAGENTTVNISGSHPAGKMIVLQVTNDGTLVRTITLGTGLKGTVAAIIGVLSKVSTIMFISNGTNFYEVGRGVGL